MIEGGKERELAHVSSSLAGTDVGGDYTVGFEEFTGWMKVSNLVVVSMSGEVKRVTPKEGIVNLGPKVYRVRHTSPAITSTRGRGSGSSLIL